MVLVVITDDFLENLNSLEDLKITFLEIFNKDHTIVWSILASICAFRHLIVKFTSELYWAMNKIIII